MKKLVRVLSLSMLLGFSFVSCTNEEEVDDTPDVKVENIKGEYFYKAVIASEAVDLDNDGVAKFNLMNENGQECVWDNSWVFTEKDVTLYERGSKCETDSPDILLTGSYIIDKIKGTITIKDSDGVTIDVLKNVLLKFDDFSGQTNLEFSVYDNELKQDLKYVLTK